MSDLIRRSDVLSKAYYSPARVVDAIEIETAPAVDAVEVVHSDWWFEEYPDGYYHSNCMACDFQAPEEAYLTQWRFCPNCGARMDGEDGKT